ncbi:conserved hypothetical protein [Ricinus communis]|uniref:Uncharacterized protein n=1 Tax=Ricinus communis TaxID=3988 RepID=B9TLS7_RICCO|nr:conserved hypothetical protein [Ricinus communis]
MTPPAPPAPAIGAARRRHQNPHPERTPHRARRRTCRRAPAPPAPRGWPRPAAPPADASRAAPPGRGWARACSPGTARRCLAGAPATATRPPSRMRAAARPGARGTLPARFGPAKWPPAARR